MTNKQAMGFAHHLIETCYYAKGHANSEVILAAHWVATNIIKLIGEKSYQLVTLKLFKEQKAEVLKRARELFSDKAEPFQIAQKLFDLNAWYDRTDKLYGPLTAQSIVQGYRTGAQRVGVELPFPPGDTRAKAVALEVLGKARGINDTMLSKIADDVLAWQESGDPLSGLEERLGNTYGIAKNRVKTIAQTTATPVFESGQELAFQDAGIKQKGWLSRRDGDVREEVTGDHVEADGQFVDMSDTFLVTGESLRWPGDPSGSAGNVINCRCTQMPGEFE